ncbi:hypothetical protein JKP88DRAFT_146602, partial [Tribonema minus]
SHTGRLGDRIRVLRERCLEGLGPVVFERAYRYLKDMEEPDIEGEESYGESSLGEGRGVAGLTEILGPSKLHYYTLLDQLIFIENS